MFCVICCLELSNVSGSAVKMFTAVNINREFELPSGFNLS